MEETALEAEEERLWQEMACSLEVGLSSLRLNSKTSEAEPGDPAATEVGMASSFPQGNDGSSKKAKLSAAGEQNPIGQKKRRSHLDSWTETLNPLYDDYQWRKYGNKNIQNSQYPRSYYRCTHEWCPARKQVQQRDSSDPPMFLVRYIKQHTCNTIVLPSSPSMVAPFPPPPREEPIWNVDGFSNGIQQEQQQQHHVLSPVTPSNRDFRGEMFISQSDNCSSSMNPTLQGIPSPESTAHTPMPDNLGSVSSTCPSLDDVDLDQLYGLANTVMQEPPDPNFIDSLFTSKI